MQPVTKNKNESVAKVLKRLRENARLTTRQAASIVGVTRTTIGHFENGKRAVEGFRVEHLCELKTYLDQTYAKVRKLIKLAVPCNNQEGIILSPSLR